MRLYSLHNQTAYQQQPVSHLCPGCYSLVQGREIGNSYLLDQHEVFLSFRFCGNPSCNTVVAIVAKPDNPVGYQVLDQWPKPSGARPEVKGAPKDILASLDEAIAAQSVEAYRASVVMCRRVVEQLCDLFSAKGSKLYDRIDNLLKEKLLSPEFGELFHSLRLLGNDAVHLDLREFDDITAEHAEVAIKTCVAVLNALFGHAELLEKVDHLKRKQVAETSSE